jgi:hypothetical protein
MQRLPIAIFAAIFLLAGCASPWEQSLVLESWDAAPVAPSGPVDPRSVELRSVPWERVQATLAELHEDAVKSDQNPADWSPERKAEEKARLLRGLQVAEDPATVQVLGRSTFTSTRLIRPEADDDAGLRKVAASVGANRAVWARSLLGTTESVVHEPVQTNYNSSGFGRDSRTGRLRNTSFSETSTTWVPTRVQQNEYGYIAFFLRVGATAPPAK